MGSVLTSRVFFSSGGFTVIRLIRCVVGWILAVSVVGCSHRSTTPRGESRLAPPLVVSPLAASVDDPRLLLSINSLSIDMPRYSSRSVTTIPEGELLRVVQEVAAQTLSMKLLSGGAPSSSADGILQTEVLELRELRGSSVGGEPAAVAIRLSIKRSRDKRTVWTASYVNRQEALSDNWLKIGQRIGAGGTGAGFVGAEALFRRGIGDSLQDFNRRRDAQFQSEGPAR